MVEKPGSLKQKCLIRVKTYFTVYRLWKSKILLFILRALAKFISYRVRASKSIFSL